ncbi:DMT family transporter [Aeromonas caviae]
MGRETATRRHPILIDPTPEAAPPWAWLGGLPGALTVVLAALCLNSPLGMAGTLALLLLGQLLFGALCDGLGWLGLARAALGKRRARRLAGDGRRPAYRAALGETP